MKKLLPYLILLVTAWSCSESEPEVYTGQKIEYKLNKASDFNYTGTLIIRELSDRNLELTIQMVGAKSTLSTTFPAHLHYGSYTDPDAQMALMLNAVSGADLKSTTVLGVLMNGSKLSFEDMKNFDGHVKVHLSSEGPDYQVILVAGNVGSNSDDLLKFDSTQMKICSSDF
ncbi:hypothetical protein LV84_02213 [Algoriphagus ratkowskyi]|uniref:CHRD domain-containing protein n=1 Tax=Algoriphagus ratkowskyi TaxID=57028 RepID=A0A2W7RAN8_9BACT|nr:hypothetical protein [Algoriphagus ratkowskyi]PZX57081.1 hypothetical protein LV84_02213 [Algoriphagus ratkowskyi]TXD79975.1 hypothetical protein ESW18_02275 [Algoriphagus ratkowskyi]